MHPPFFPVDHKVGPDIRHFDERKPRRNRPQGLVLSPATTGWPPVPLLPSMMWDGHTVALPSGVTLHPNVRLTVVPLPRNTLRDHIGRWLIRVGQRMILQNRPG